MSLGGIVAGQQAFAAEHGIGPGHEAQGLHFVIHALASRRQAHMRFRHQDAGDGDGADEVERIGVLQLLHRGAGDADQKIDRQVVTRIQHKLKARDALPH